jgi:hypothetical protein
MPNKSWRSRLEEYTVEGVIRAVVELILIGAASYLFSKILSSVIEVAAPYKYGIAVIVFCIVTLLILYIRKRSGRLQPYYPKLDFDFQITESELTYDHKDKNRMIYTKRKKIKALKNGLDRYLDRYHWTGVGQVNVKSAVADQELALTERRSIWQFYEIKLPRPLNAGDEIQTEVVWELEDTEGKAVPFMSATIEEPTDKLKMNLMLPPELGVKKATQIVSMCIGAKKPMQTADIEFNRHGELEFQENRPKLLYNYELRWHW